MPTYSYACTSCDHRFDIQQGFADEPLTECPVCAARLRKLFGNVGVVFKGSGFYRTDARADKRGASPKAGAPKSDAPSGAPSGAGGRNGVATSAERSGSNGSVTPAPTAPAPAGAKAASD